MTVSVKIRTTEKDTINEIARIELYPDDVQRCVENIKTRVDIVNFVFALSKLFEVSPLDKRHAFVEPVIREFTVKIASVEALAENVMESLSKVTVKSASEILFNDLNKINFKNDDFEIYTELT